MSTKRNVMKFVLIVFIVFAVSCVVKFAVDKIVQSDFIQDEIIGNKDFDSGLTVKDAEGNVLDIDPAMVSITEDNVVVSGTALDDVTIDVNRKVKNITFENLDQGDYMISVNLPLKGECNVKFKGENEIYSLYSFDNLVLTADSTDDVLTVAGGIDADGDVFTINGGTIYSTYLYSFCDMKISGETIVYVQPYDRREFDEEYMMDSSLISAGLLNVDLSGKGMVVVNDPVYEAAIMSSETGIELGKNTKIVTPESAEIKLEDYDDYIEYFIGFSDGSLPEKIIIKCVK